MAISASNMLALYKAGKPAPSQTNDPTAAAVAADAYALAFFKAIVDDIHANMTVASSGADPQGGTVASTSTAIL